ncbi:hypothetical protein AMTR_s00347p00001090, partial [Amborella trichopoda]
WQKMRGHKHYTRLIEPDFWAYTRPKSHPKVTQVTPQREALPAYNVDIASILPNSFGAACARPVLPKKRSPMDSQAL